MLRSSLFIVVILFIIPFCVYSQKGSNHLKFSAGAEMTSGIFKEGYKTGWGLHATDYIGIDKNSSVLFSTGIAKWNGDNSSFKVGLMFLKTGYRLFAVEGFYLQGEAGLAKGFEEFNNGTFFTYSAGPGYLIKKGNGGIDLAAKFNHFGYRTWFSFLVGYQFKLK